MPSAGQSSPRTTTWRGAEIHRLSIDAGERWLLADAAGQPLQAWDSRGTQPRQTTTHCAAPPAFTSLQGRRPERVAEQITYGETLADAQTLNLRGAAYQHRDEAGVATTSQRDFKGNVLSASRGNFSATTGRRRLVSVAAPDAETFTTATTYDALNRPITVTAPDGSVTTRSSTNAACSPSVTVSLAGAAAADQLRHQRHYDAKGQRQQISYGNGAITTYTYDPDTFRLVRLQTHPAHRAAGHCRTCPTPMTRSATSPASAMRPSKPSSSPTRSSPPAPTTPTTPSTGSPRPRAANTSARHGHRRPTGTTRPGSSCRCPPTARPCATTPRPTPTTRSATSPASPTPLPTATGPAPTATTSRQPAGNNHLTSTTVGAATEQLQLRPDGNIITMPHLPLMQWDWNNQLQATAIQSSPADARQTTYYTYSHSGDRVRKITVTRQARSRNARSTSAATRCTGNTRQPALSLWNGRACTSPTAISLSAWSRRPPSTRRRHQVLCPRPRSATSSATCSGRRSSNSTRPPRSSPTRSTTRTAARRFQSGRRRPR